MNNQDNSDFYIVVFVAIAIVIGGLTWKFSQAFNLDWETGSKVLLGLVILIGLLIFSLYTGWFPIIYPLLLGTLWMVFWPALDYWSLNDLNNLAFDRYSGKSWWAQWYTKAGILVSLVGGPYLIQKLRY